MTALAADRNLLFGLLALAVPARAWLFGLGVIGAESLLLEIQ